MSTSFLCVEDRVGFLSINSTVDQFKSRRVRYQPFPNQSAPVMSVKHFPTVQRNLHVITTSQLLLCYIFYANNSTSVGKLIIMQNWPPATTTTLATTTATTTTTPTTATATAEPQWIFFQTSFSLLSVKLECIERWGESKRSFYANLKPVFVQSFVVVVFGLLHCCSCCCCCCIVVFFFCRSIVSLIHYEAVNEPWENE